MSADAVIKRLHVGGITPNISTDHLKDRFASFGKVHKVEELAPNALGDKRPFTFLTIEIQPSQLKKCLNIMSGSTWRGTQLKVAEAKPSYTSRMMAETFAAPVDEANMIKKRKRRHRAFNLAEGIGKPAQDLRLTNMDNYAKRKFWNLTPSGHLVRPLSIRPTHALPPSSQVKAGDPSKPRLPPRRARRRVINPSLWDPTHLAEDALQNGYATSGHVEDGWEWHEADPEDEEIPDEANDDQRRLVGWWRRVVDGEVLEEQAVRGKRRRIWDTIDVESDFEDEVDAEEVDTDSELFAARDNTRADSPLFGNVQRTETVVDHEHEDAPQSVTSSRTASPLFGPRPDAVVASELPSPPQSPTSLAQEEEEEEDAAPQLPEEGPQAGTLHEERSSSPLSATKAVRKSNQRVEPKVKTNVAVPEPIRRQVLQEKSRDMSLLDSILGNIADEPALATRNPFFGGYAESDEDEEEEEEEEPLRLRGGAASDDEDEDMSSDSGDTASTSSSSGSSSTSSSDSDSDSDSDEGTDTDDVMTEKPSSSASTRAQAPVTGGSLKDMFAPAASTNAGGFSLLASLDPDLELDELDVPLAPALRPQTDELAPLEPLQATSTVSGLFDPDPEIPLFFPISTSFAPSSEQGQRKGKDQYAEDVAQSGWRGFWRAEGETDEMMKEIWEKERFDLTREWKKRHREAKKHRRRRGGVDEE